MALAANVSAEHLQATTESPTTETFSTPLSSPFPFGRMPAKTKPNLIQLENPDAQCAGMNPNITLDFTSPTLDDAGSPVDQKTPRSEQLPGSSLSPHAASAHPQALRHRRLVQSPASPCFVHSLLDKGASLRNFLQLSHPHPSPEYNNSIHSSESPDSDSGRGTSLRSEPLSGGSSDKSGVMGVAGGPSVGVAKILDPQRHGAFHHEPTYLRGSATDSDLSLSEDEEEGNSLTRQLAETAVGVRELSKQLGKYLYFFLHFFYPSYRSYSVPFQVAPARGPISRASSLSRKRVTIDSSA